MIILMCQVLLLSIINSAISEQFGAIKLFAALEIESMMVALLMGLMWKRLCQKMFKTA